MTTVSHRPMKVVTDSEDDQSDVRHRTSFRITSQQRGQTTSDDDKKNRNTFKGSGHTIPIHTVSKVSALSKEAPPENYSGFIRLGSK